MLSYILIMIIATQSGSVTVQQYQPDEQTCIAIEQNIAEQVNNNHSSVVSQGCYETNGGAYH